MYFVTSFFSYTNIVSILCQCCVKYQYGSAVNLVNNFSLWSLSFYRIFLLSVIFLLPLILAMLSWLESSSFFPVLNRVSFEFQYSRLFDILCSFDILFHRCQLFSRVNDNLNPVLNDIVWSFSTELRTRRTGIHFSVNIFVVEMWHYFLHIRISKATLSYVSIFLFRKEFRDNHVWLYGMDNNQ